MWLARHEIPLLTFHAVAERSTVAQRRDTGIYAVTASLPAYALKPLPGEGPEDVVAGPEGVIYTGLLMGASSRSRPRTGRCGRWPTPADPLGLEATADGRLLICDSPKGLLELNLKTGALTPLVTHEGGERLIFCSNVVAASGGDLFFTVSSMRYDVREWKKDIVENVPTGRVYRRAADGAFRAQPGARAGTYTATCSLRFVIK